MKPLFLHRWLSFSIHNIASVPHTLQITQTNLDQHALVRLRYESPSGGSEATATVPFFISRQDEEDVRWYLEEFLQFSIDPAPLIAAKVEGRMAEIGHTLFRMLFRDSRMGEELWQQIAPHLSDIDVELTDSSGYTFPWEMMQDPLDTVPVACQAKSFVYVIENLQPEISFQVTGETMRVLMVISRPGGNSDVPFRSVATRLLQSLGNRQTVRIEVLRPSTVDALDDRLQAAAIAGQPFQILHFDGHGIYANLMESHGAKGKKRGYLMFEDGDNPLIPQPVDGRRLGRLLSDNNILVVVLNACRSAWSASAEESSDSNGKPLQQSFDSLAKELIRYGVPVVVAMQYNIYVNTAACFVSSLYHHLQGGEVLSDAFTQARRDLFENPDRTSETGSYPLKDWMVPLMFRAAGTPPLTFRTSYTAEEALDAEEGILPPPPLNGFAGRDNTLLMLDRLFQNRSLVLLWGMMGAGKTSAAAEFGRWIKQTAGTTYRLLFTSFATYRSLLTLVNDAASVLHGELEAKGIVWLALPETRRLQVFLEVISTQPCLWIWDNLETLQNKTGSSSPEPQEDIGQLGDFLQSLLAQNVKILATSRLNRLPWINTKTELLELPPMEMEERRDLVTSILEAPCQPEIWLPLLEFSQGNPFALSLLTRQVVRNGDSGSRAAIDRFVALIKAGVGENGLDHSVKQALQNEFAPKEQAVLSVCCLFDGIVSNRLITAVYFTKWDESEEMTLVAAILERASGLGLFASVGNGYYTFHPALTSYLTKLFLDHHPGSTGDTIRSRFVLILSLLSQSFCNSYLSGELGSADRSIKTLSAHESNFRAAFTLSTGSGDWVSGFAVLFGLFTLYKHSGRWLDIGRLVDQALPYYVDTASGQPLPGREQVWADFQHLRVELFIQNHQLNEALRLQEDIVAQKRREEDNPAAVESVHIRGLPLIYHLFRLAGIRKEQSVKDCFGIYSEALDMAQRQGDVDMEGDIAFQMAGAYLSLDVPDLVAADYWLHYALEITSPEDRIRYGQIKSAMGRYALLQSGRAAESQADNIRWLDMAVQNLEMSLQILPMDMIDTRNRSFSDLGRAYSMLGNQQSQSVSVLQQTIKFAESAEDAYTVGEVQFRLAVLYKNAGKADSASLYADAALLTFASLAPEAETELLQVQDFLEELAQDKV